MNQKFLEKFGKEGDQSLSDTVLSINNYLKLEIRGVHKTNP